MYGILQHLGENRITERQHFTLLILWKSNLSKYPLLQFSDQPESEQLFAACKYFILRQSRHVCAYTYALACL